MPVLMLMLITLLNDGTLIAIGYDNVKPLKTPERWNLRVMEELLYSILCGKRMYGIVLVVAVLLGRCDWRGGVHFLATASVHSSHKLEERGMPCMYTYV